MKRLTMVFGIFTLSLGAWPALGDWSTPVNLGPGVNTNLHDFAPSLSVSGDTLYFVRLESNDEDYNIYMSVFRGGAWDSAVSVGDSINNSPGNFEGSPFISYDGSRLYFTRAPQSTHYPYNIYYSERRNGVWQGPKRFEAPWNNDSSNAAWSCFTHDGKRLYFYSYNRPGGRGYGDLWYSNYDSLGQVWGPPVNMGDSINTSGFDLCPTLSWDDQTLYFESESLPTHAGFICRSRLVNGVWQKRENLPGIPNYPPPGTSNYPCLSADGQHLFFGGGFLPLPSYGKFDIYDSQWVVGVEETSPPRLTPYVFPLKVTPNPFTSFATLPGHEAERFSLYDISGRKVGTYRGDRIGEGLVPGVYFLRSSDSQAKPLRIVKVR